jgi:hypothetical protein
MSKEDLMDLLFRECPNIKNMSVQSLIDRINITDEQFILAKNIGRENNHKSKMPMGIIEKILPGDEVK